MFAEGVLQSGITRSMAMSQPRTSHVSGRALSTMQLDLRAKCK